MSTTPTQTTNTASEAESKNSKATADTSPSRGVPQSLRGPSDEPRKDRREERPREGEASTVAAPSPSPSRLTLILASIAITLSGASAIFTTALYLTTNTHTTLTPSTTDGNSANFTEGSIAEIATKVSPAVVSIITESRTTSWFGQSSTSSSAGTGMIATSDGYVITNKHVVDGANTVSVILDDGTTYDDVTVIGTDPLNDVAFLKINNVNDLPTVTLGDSKTITVGQQVIAIGNALGQYSNSVTEGIISGTGRSVTASDSEYSSNYESLSDMIQTDASINPGNSGGPLVNAAGEVIGINTAVSANAQGIGFTIPISSIKGMLKSVIETGKATRAYLGVSYTNITPDLAKKYNLPVKQGAYIYTGNNRGSAIISGGPAEKAGLTDGDIITKVNGIELGSNGAVSSLIGEYTVGDTVQLAILHDGQEKTVDVTLEAYPTTNNAE